MWNISSVNNCDSVWVGEHVEGKGGGGGVGGGGGLGVFI